MRTAPFVHFEKNPFPLNITNNYVYLLGLLVCVITRREVTLDLSDGEGLRIMLKLKEKKLKRKRVKNTQKNLSVPSQELIAPVYFVMFT